MSEGAVCECGHYLDHHDDEGYCQFEWKGEKCECTVYRDDSGLHTDLVAKLDRLVATLDRIDNP